MAKTKTEIRQTEDAPELLGSGPDAIRKWANETDPPPSRESVLAHINWLRANDGISENEVRSLSVDYPELAGL
jgi:hypothetical protein